MKNQKIECAISKIERVISKREVIMLYAAHDIAYTKSLTLFNGVNSIAFHMMNDEDRAVLDQAHRSMKAIEDDLHLLGAIIDAYNEFRMAKFEHRPERNIAANRRELVGRINIWNHVHPETPIIK